jgi:hypothetical protein
LAKWDGQDYASYEANRKVFHPQRKNPREFEERGYQDALSKAPVPKTGGL